MACLFREFAVITDHHADGAAIGLDDRVALAALDVPPAPFRWCGVELLLGVNRAIAQEDVGHVENVAILHLARV